MRGMVRPDTNLERKSRSLNRSRAREMRHAPAVTEKHFWNEIRDRKLGGHKFRRQYLIGPYIVDYVCLEKKLIVELDGVLHANRADYDDQRDAFLREQGYRVIRFRNDDLLDDMSGTLPSSSANSATPPHPGPLPHFVREREQ